MLEGIHHVAILVSNYEKSKDFYVNCLGFQVLRENYRKGKDSYKLDLRLGNYEVELFSMNGCPPRPNYPEAYGLRHLAFRPENLDETIKKLNQLGIETEPIRVDEYTGGRYTFFWDPDGLPLELHE